MSTKSAFRVWVAAILLLSALAISESTAIAQCPPVGANTNGCGTTITITNDSFTVTHSNQGPYDTIDDTLVGVVNMSTTRTIASIGLRSSLPIFAFDGDGICGNSPITDQPYSPRPNGCPFKTGPGSTGYEGPGVTFEGVSQDFKEGTVKFATPIAINGGSAYFSLEEAINTTPGCANGINHALVASIGPSGSRPGVVMNATFTPFGGITNAATNCTFDKFNWISEITVPPPVPFWQNPLPEITTRRLLPDTSYNDPVQGGYTYDTNNPIWNSYPYYWDININNTNHSLINTDPLKSNLTATTLKFEDKPTDACLPSPTTPAGASNSSHGCDNHYAAAGSKLKFKTRVVGIRNSAPLTPVELGIFFKWESSFNGTVGGVSRTANLQDPDPGIGTGGITITEVQDVTNYPADGIAVTTVNGAPLESIPPAIMVAVTPSKLWPPNNLMVPVTVSGTMSDAGGAGLNLSTAAYVVMDEYGLVQPKGAVTLDSNGSYSFTIQLQALRKGDDEDGRQYHITVSAEDNAGNKGSSSTLVIVPHDQRHDRKHHRKHHREDDLEHDRGHEQRDDQKHDERDDRRH